MESAAIARLFLVGESIEIRIWMLGPLRSICRSCRLPMVRSQHARLEVRKGQTMPKYLIQGSYTPEGLKGLMKDTASGRKAAVQAAMKSVKGKLESLHFALFR